MRTRSTLTIIVLIAAMLACKQSDVEAPSDNEIPSYTQILSVSVTPPSGSGSFTLEVVYEDAHGADSPPGRIYCNYVTPNIATMPIGVILPEFVSFLQQSPIAWVTHTKELGFSVQQANGVIRPGSYMAGCQTAEGSPVTTPFTVIDDTAVTPTALSAMPSPTDILVPTAGGNSFQPTQVNGAGKLGDYYQGAYVCWTDANLTLKVNADGSAELEAKGPSGWDVDLVTCGQTGWLETWIIVGSVNPGTETITFTSCNNNEFTAQGTISYAGGVLSGEVTCLNKSGNYAGKPDVVFTVP